MLTKQGLGIHYNQLDKFADVYRFGIGQFYEHLTINRLYENRKELIDKNLDYLYQSMQKVLFISIIYSCFIIVTTLGMLSIMIKIKWMPLFMLQYYILVILSSTFLTFVSGFRIINDSVSIVPINVFINLIQICSPIIIYIYILPRFSIEFTMMTYVLCGLIVNLLSFLAYYIAMCITFKKIVTPKATNISLTCLQDIYYLSYTLSKNLLVHMFVNIFMMFFNTDISYEDQLKVYYIINSGYRNVSGTFLTPMDWVARVYVSKYQNTKDFIITSYIVFGFYFILLGTIISYIIKLGIYDKLMIIKFDNIAYYKFSLLLSTIAVIGRLWEITVVAQKKDSYPTKVLFSSMLIYFITSFTLVKIGYSIVFSLFSGITMHLLMQYICFMIRGHMLLKLNKSDIISELCRYGILLGFMYAITTIIL
jgi:hypothetical protein